METIVRFVARILYTEGSLEVIGGKVARFTPAGGGRHSYIRPGMHDAGISDRGGLYIQSDDGIIATSEEAAEALTRLGIEVYQNGEVLTF